MSKYHGLRNGTLMMRDESASISCKANLQAMGLHSSLITQALITCATVLSVVLLLSCTDLSHQTPLKVAEGWSSSSTLSSGSSSSVDVSSSSQGRLNTQACAFNARAQTLTCPEKIYRTTVIGTQVWMAENLDFATTSGLSRCYADIDSNCTKYGRLYDYPTAMLACPIGWHLPSNNEWITLEYIVGGQATAGTKLKATYGWSNANGTDDYGFTALPGGRKPAAAGDSVTFTEIGSAGFWWTDSAVTSSWGLERELAGGAGIGYLNFSLYNGFSVRCVFDSASTLPMSIPKSSSSSGGASSVATSCRDGTANRPGPEYHAGSKPSAHTSFESVG